MLLTYLYKFLGSIFSKIFINKIGKLLPSRNLFKSELSDIINETCKTYATLYDQKSTDGKFPFYQSQKIIDEFLKFSPAHIEDFDLNIILSVINNNTNIIPPTRENIENFYGIFLERVKANPKISDLEIAQKFQNEIFEISRKLDNRSIEGNLWNSNELEQQWKSRLNVYIEKLKEFKPATALSLLESLEKSFEESRYVPSENLQSKIAYQKGWCYNFLLKKNESCRAFILAYEISPNNIVFKEQAALAYHKIDELEKSNILTDELLKRDGNNSIGWAVKILNSNTEDFEKLMTNLPKLVAIDITFIKTMYNVSLMKNKKEYIERLYDNNFIPSQIDILDENLTIDNYGIHIFWINVLLAKIVQQSFIDFSKIQEHENVPELNKILKKIFLSICSSEIEKNHYEFFFFYEYTNFLLYKKHNTTLEMRNWYNKIETSNDFQTLICANCLQIAGYHDAAIKVLEDSNSLFIPNLKLLSYCYLKIHDSDNYVLAIKKYFSSIKNIDKVYLGDFLETIIQLKIFGRLAQFNMQDLVENKTFETENIEIFVKAITNTLFQNVLQDNKKAIIEFAEKNSNHQILSIVANTFYFVREYELAINFFVKFLNYSEESRDLFYYV